MLYTHFGNYQLVASENQTTDPLENEMVFVQRRNEIVVVALKVITLYDKLNITVQ